MSANPTESDGNNPVSRSSQNKSQLLEAMVRNVPKLKELNYTQWKNIMTNSIKKAKLWGYVDGSIKEPLEHESGSLATYYDEAGAVRNAIHGSLEPAAQKYLEEALDPREAWLTLEKKYLTAESDADARLVSIEKQLTDLRLEEGGDVIGHIAEFCRMRSQLNGSRFVVDDQACLTMLYRSLPSSCRQSVLSSEGTEMKDFNALCARLAYVSQNLESEASAKDEPPVPVENYTNWGVPEDVKALGLTGGKNPLLQERAVVTCRDCLLKDHKAGTPECPQYTWRKELWGTEEENETERGLDVLGGGLFSELPISPSSKRLGYEFSEPVKVVLNFDEIGLKSGLKIGPQYSVAEPSAIQQCAILPMIRGRNVIAQAPANDGKTTALAISVLHLIDATLPHTQALIFTSTGEAANGFKQIVNKLQSYSSLGCYVCELSNPLTAMNPASLTNLNKYHIFVGTPGCLLELVRRNLINIPKLRTVALEDVDKLIQTGAEEQIHEAYQYIPPLTQVIASSTAYSLPIAKAAAKLMADPLQVLVHRNEGMSVGVHFYVKVPANQKPRALLASFSVLKANGVVVLCRDVPQIQGSFHYLQESMKPHEREATIRDFKSYSNSRRSKDSGFGYYHSSSGSSSTVALVVPDKSFSTTGLLNVGVPLIEYDIPSSVKEYVKRLDRWRVVNPGRAHTIITFVTADTEEVQVVQDFEQCYGIHVAELLWDANSLR
ncbi:unnamed protein product [Rhizoctonia solani]|uniref:ATP-dependent RNA helicase n=1 Tax=Rhizoctonia solani TaxID=456999 RepID=A0A8H3E947_9AGAM|nr:unnamed protein product [Rhizoctonia solani]